MTGYFKAAVNVMLLITIWIASVLVLGVAVRAMKEVFCLGYGC